MIRISNDFIIEKCINEKGDILFEIENYNNCEFPIVKMYIIELDMEITPVIEDNKFYFHLPNTIKKGKYLYNITLANDYEEQNIIYCRRLIVNE